VPVACPSARTPRTCVEIGGLGRYLESDPIGLTGGPSTYMYADGNPIAWTDVFGLRADTDLCAGLSAHGCMQIGQAYGPDYVTVNVILPSVLTLAYTVTRDGSTYHHAGIGMPSKGSMNGKWGFNLSFGKMLTGCDTDDDIDQFVNGMSGGGGFYDGAGVGLTANQNGAAMEVGVGIGGLGAQGSGAAPAGHL